MMAILSKWNESQVKQFQNDIVAFDHGLANTGLFTDDALAALIDRHPPRLIDVCTRAKSPDPHFPGRLRTGDFRDCTGQDLIAAAREGWVWINMREAMLIHPEYKKILDEMYDGVREMTGRKIYNPKGGILITSPVARTPYHFDKTEVILWHIRGKKRVYIYPLEDPYISDEVYERTLINPIDDDLPYEISFDEGARIFDLEEGQAMTWPLNSPHKVENNSFCVSVTTEYSTPESAVKNGAMIANATWRERFGGGSTYSEQSRTGRVLRSVFGRTIKKAGLSAKVKPTDMVSFKIDPSAPGFIVDTEPFERNF